MLKPGYLPNGAPMIDVRDVEGGLLGEGLVQVLADGRPARVAWLPNGERHDYEASEAREMADALNRLAAVTDYLNRELF
ncbi:MAG TPA: hypothetical protein VFF79_12935 [Conexibacter sp.]|jgi:hypothetical protein|nr:hypothetical protein [Conexibacter sp.]